MPSHRALVKRAAAWLNVRCKVSLVEPSSFMCDFEVPDGIGWDSSGTQTHLIEVKVTRADFLADKEKTFRRGPERGMGRLRWYLTPPGLLTRDDLPPHWGLLEAHPKLVRVIKQAEPQPRNAAAELRLLVALTERSQNTLTAMAAHARRKGIL